MYTASVYQKPDCFLLQAHKQTVDGWRLADIERPVITFPITVAAVEIGSALINLIQTSRIGGTRPLDWKVMEKAQLQSLGMKSVKELHKDCKLCSVALNGNTFKFYSTQNQKTAFANIKDVVIIVEEAIPQKIGEAIFACLSKSV
jgi:hypothetical protein